MVEQIVKLGCLLATLSFIVPWLFSYKFRYRVKNAICQDEDSNAVWMAVFTFFVGVLSEIVWTFSHAPNRGEFFLFLGVALLATMILQRTLAISRVGSYELDRAIRK